METAIKSKPVLTQKKLRKPRSAEAKRSHQARFLEAARLTPVSCRHCKGLVYEPPAYMTVLLAMAQGSGKPELEATATTIAQLAKIKRELAYYAVKQGLAAKVLELVPNINGTKLYRRTPYARTILNQWKAANWKA